MALREGHAPTYVAQRKGSVMPYRSGILYTDALNRTWEIAPNERRRREMSFWVKVGTARANLRKIYLCESLHCARNILHWHSERAKEIARDDNRARAFRASAAAKFRRR